MGLRSRRCLIQKQLPEIAGFEIKIEKLQGKFKLNQNRTAEDREGVIEALSAGEDPEQRAVASLMAQRRRTKLS